jgi:HMG (high mobility group) box
MFHSISSGRSEIKKMNPEMKNTEVSRILGDEWRKMTEEERAPFVEKEEGEREQYKINMEEWKRQMQEKEESERERQCKAQMEHATTPEMAFGMNEAMMPGVYQDQMGGSQQQQQYSAMMMQYYIQQQNRKFCYQISCLEFCMESVVSTNIGLRLLFYSISIPERCSLSASNQRKTGCA